jgi:hypothetical protein
MQGSWDTLTGKLNHCLASWRTPLATLSGIPAQQSALYINSQIRISISTRFTHGEVLTMAFHHEKPYIPASLV